MPKASMAGPVEATNELYRQLSKALRAKVIGTISLTIDANERQVLAETLKLMKDAERTGEIEIVEHLIEAAEKLHDPSWSSAGYLRESTGPLAPTFRELAGDRLVEQLTLNSDGSLSDELDGRWQAYLDAFVSFYQLDDKQRELLASECLTEMSADELEEYLRRSRSAPRPAVPKTREAIRSLKTGGFVLQTIRIDTDDLDAIRKSIDLLKTALQKARRIERAVVRSQTEISDQETAS